MEWFENILKLYQVILLTFPDIILEWPKILPENLYYKLFLKIKSEKEYYLQLVDTLSVIIPILDDNAMILLINNLFNLFKLDTTYNCSGFGLHCYFTLICRLLEKSNNSIVEKLSKYFSLEMLNKVLFTTESEDESVNQIKAGYIKIFSSLINMNKSLLSEIESKKLCEDILKKCLFGPNDDTLYKNMPLFLDYQVRSSCLSLLSSLMLYESNQLLLLEYVCKFIEITPELKKSSHITLRKKNTFTGLVNPCCICYMNSLMQQFYMISQFRKGIINSQGRKDPENGDDDLLYQLQKLFLYLEYTYRSAYNSKSFVYANKDEEGRPTNVAVQQDSFEFLQNLTDNIEVSLKGQANGDLIKTIFSGKINNQTVCKGGCNTKTNSSETSYFLSLNVEGYKNLNESLEGFVSGNIISDYNCENCKKKVDITRRDSFLDLSNIVIIHLKRFKWNYDTFEREKINDRFEFPLEIDLYYFNIFSKPFSSEALGDVIPEKERGKDYYLYDLKGVVVHSGTADSGHYYSFIQDRKTEKWYQFNDESVTPFDIKELDKECYGNESSNEYSYKSIV